MKTQKKVCAILFTLMVFLFASNVSANVLHDETVTFKVYGNCEMCKKNIETALLKNQNIKKASWDVKTKMLTVVYDPHTISVENIHKLVANAGYDTDTVKAPDDAYNKLHGCCQYKRPANKTK
jgi:mercuric ion binding protein